MKNYKSHNIQKRGSNEKRWIKFQKLISIDQNMMSLSNWSNWKIETDVYIGGKEYERTVEITETA